MDFLEFIFYESLPFIYAGLSTFAFLNHDKSIFVGLAAIILAFCSYQVFVKRFRYRSYVNRKIMNKGF